MQLQLVCVYLCMQLQSTLCVKTSILFFDFLLFKPLIRLDSWTSWTGCQHRRTDSNTGWSTRHKDNMHTGHISQPSKLEGSWVGMVCSPLIVQISSLLSLTSPWLNIHDLTPTTTSLTQKPNLNISLYLNFWRPELCGLAFCPHNEDTVPTPHNVNTWISHTPPNSHSVSL